MKIRAGFAARCARAAAIVASVALGVQCSFTIDAEREQCSTTADCRARGGEFAESVCKNSVCIADPAWSCSSEESGTDTEPSSKQFVVRIPVISVLNQQPIPGVTARMYRKIDVDAASPVGDPVASDANGIIELKVDSGYDGFLTLTHENIGPSLYFFNPPVRKNETVAPVRLASPAMVSALFQQVGKTFDPTRGIVVLTAEDCTGAPAEGIAFDSTISDANTQPFYSVDGLPTTSTEATDASGYGGLIGLTPGTLAITGSRDLDTETPQTIGKLSLFVKASSVSYSRMVPNGRK
ncbi:MAG: hypothetical protein QM784_16970 [Polyangiaceae bacterium]